MVGSAREIFRVDIRNQDVQAVIEGFDEQFVFVLQATNSGLRCQDNSNEMPHRPVSNRLE